MSSSHFSDEIRDAFIQFGSLTVDWPHKAQSKAYFPPKGMKAHVSTFSIMWYCNTTSSFEAQVDQCPYTPLSCTLSMYAVPPSSRLPVHAFVSIAPHSIWILPLPSLPAIQTFCLD